MRLENKLNVISLLKLLVIIDRNGDDISLFKKDVVMEYLFCKYDPDDLDKLLNGLSKQSSLKK